MTEKVFRNISCAFYRKCLTKAVKENTDFDCSHCKHRNNDDFREEINLEAYQLLLWAVFKPNLYRRYKKMESAHAQSKKSSEPGRPDDAMRL